MHSRKENPGRLCILVNTVAPYRLPLYEFLAQRFKVFLLSGGKEGNRNWNVKSSVVRIIDVRTWQISYRKQTGIEGISRLAFLHLNVGLLWWLPRLRPDMIISNEMGGRTIIAILYGKVTNVPVWIWWGGTLHSERNTGRLRQVVRRMIVDWSQGWISYGVSSSEYLKALGVRRENILEIQNCVRQDIFLQPLSCRPWFGDLPGPVLLYVGQLIERKGLDLLVEACGRLARRGFRFSLVLVGEGQVADALRRLAAQVSLQDLHIFPNQSPETINVIYRSANALIFPTIEDVWGLVVNEAIWAGLPVLCSKYAGCAQELVDESNIFDPLVEESFDAALQKFVEGEVVASDRSKLRTWEQVGLQILSAIESPTVLRRKAESLT
jgi:glycosyltransferase involved in cell wall biosynthesis